MPRPVALKVIVNYLDGSCEKYEAGIHFSEKTSMLHIWPKGTTAVIKIPLANIKKVIIDE